MEEEDEYMDEPDWAENLALWPLSLLITDFSYLFHFLWLPYTTRIEHPPTTMNSSESWNLISSMNICKVLTYAIQMKHGQLLSHFVNNIMSVTVTSVARQKKSFYAQ
ncbi:hypothetical protein MNBD_GAMMA09-143 [hydrothermal vent metagenome]|uniref:Uncharacterized protein n=1 Tax=hydrothermal vent metagenome TaxID=652676 RepID=A0A3B0Y6A9_9ZZZZ